MLDPTWTVLLLASPWATALIPLTLRLLPGIGELAHLIVSFRAAQPTPQSTHHFETELARLLREVGRLITEWVYNGFEPDERALMPAQVHSQGTWYRCRDKTANRHVACLFGKLTLWRYLYQPWEEGGPAIFPLELRLGLEFGVSSPALSERVADWASRCPQNTVLQWLRRDHALSWSVASLRSVVASVSAAMAPHTHDAQVQQLLTWLKQAEQSRGSRKPVLAVGRDGIFVPIRDHDRFREAATGTISVSDRSGHRLGTVYLGQMPQEGQTTLTGQLSALITGVLTQWTGPLPRLAYVTDAGHHPNDFFQRVLNKMRHPCHPTRRLVWERVVDYWHACGYVHQLADALFGVSREGHAWACKMCKGLKTKSGAVNRILHSAAALRHRRGLVGELKSYREAYAYLRKYKRFMAYARYRANHLPIGSGVTEAACKTVFTQRLKQSGMAWSLEGGQRIVDLRIVLLSGVWDRVYQSSLQAMPLPQTGSQQGVRRTKAQNAA